VSAESVAMVEGWLNCVRITGSLRPMSQSHTGKKLQFTNFWLVLRILHISHARVVRRWRERTSGHWRIGLMTGKPTRRTRQTRFSLFLDQRKWPANRRTSPGNHSGPSGLTNSSPTGSKVLRDHFKILGPET